MMIAAQGSLTGCVARDTAFINWGGGGGGLQLQNFGREIPKAVSVGTFGKKGVGEKVRR
jgi:hypothetical protein